MELPPIRLLPPGLRDQIAAGEVVERPSSVVKELVENSLDAGARTIRVEVEGGGLDRIVVIDDGHGMDREGALMALQRHATSKITAFDDLFRLHSFGFRGEAIPSIAAVSRTTITTRPEDALAAVQVTSGEPPEVREVGAPSGTSIEVAELFYNVPARRKFLKSVGTESGHVSDVCVDLALVRPDVALTLVRDGKVARQWLRAPDREARGRDVLSKTAEGMRGLSLAHVAVNRGSMRVEALLSPPERARAGATGLHLLVNGRAVRDRQLARAVAMAYGSVLDPGRYPIGIVWVDLPSEDLDVNVHPQKAEVRFARGREAFDDVTRAIMSRLGDAFRSPQAFAPPSASVSFLDSGVVSDVFPSPPTELQPESLSPATLRFGEAIRITNPGDPWGLGTDLVVDSAPPTRLKPVVEVTITNKPDSSPGIPHTVPSAAIGPAHADSIAATLLMRGTQEQARVPSEYGSLRFLAQARSTYLLCEGRDALYVIDQHAAAERITFARLRASFEKRAVERQQLLVPEVVAVRSAESALVDEAREELLGLGVDARAIGDGKIAVHGIPAILAKKASPEQIVRDVLDELSKTGERKFGDAVDLVLATMACHGSVRAGDTLHPDECAALLRDLDGIDFAGYCPHGRPIVTVLPFNDLEKKVGRR